jgi:hypothetical protein
VCEVGWRYFAVLILAMLSAWAHTASGAEYTIWPAAAVPVVTGDPDSNSIEIGVKFRSDVAGVINGIRFYKSAANTGVHTAALWTRTGTKLASATFVNETPSGWQEVRFAAPVAVTAGTTYVASYHANGGHYAGDSGYFTTQGVDSGPLHALKNGVDGANGVYIYSASSTFPTNTYNSSNYWVDVIFTPSSTACPCTIWPSTAVPAVPADTDQLSIEVGVKFRADVSGSITGIRFYKSTANTGTHVATLWSVNGTKLAQSQFVSETASGWQQVNFSSPVTITAGVTYVASYHANGGHYAGDGGYFASSGVDSGPLHALKNGVDGSNGVYIYSSTPIFPTQTYQSTNYWVDVVFATSTVPDNTPPTVVGQTPAPNATQVPRNSAVTTAFSESVQAGTLTSTTFALKDPGGALVPAQVTYNDTTKTATLTPNALLQSTTVYTASVSGVKDLAGNAMAGAVTWSFTTAAVSNSQCPCTIWPFTIIPESPADPDSLSIEVGLKFKSDVSGVAKGVRFYKMATNTGQHTGHLWTSSGTLLGSVTFTNETNSGWQQASFANPIPINASTTYVVSYHANVGHYSDDINYFASSGVDSGPLHALQDGVDGGNGVYAYSPNAIFPNNPWKSSNYWVDVVFDTSSGPSRPAVIDVAPNAGALSVGTGTTIGATFNESVIETSIQFTLTGPGGITIPTQRSYDDATHTASWQPSSLLTQSTTYTATVTSATDAIGQTMASPVSWSFTTASNNIGQWSAVYDWPCVAIHAHLLPDGNILSWADDDGPNGARNGGSTKTYVVPIPPGGVPGTPIAVPNNEVNLFCSGHTFLPDGRLLTTGGHTGVDAYGADSVVIFNSQQYGWSLQPQKMNQGRWYPTTAGLATGEAVVLGGSYAAGQYDNLPQLWLANSGGGFRDLTTAQLLVKYYPKMHLAPNGKLFMAGPDQLTRYLDTSGTGQWTNVGNRLYGSRDYGSSAMYDDGKIIIAGGGDPPTATAEVIDLNAATPTWQWTAPMQFARRHMNATILPDGKVLVTGGTSSGGFNDATLSVLAAEMWDPATGAWSTLANMQVPRLYHSTAILLPDGRVLSAGGGRPPASGGGTDNWNAEIFSPPYLFKGARPTISFAPSTVNYGQVFAVQTPDAASITKVTLVRLSSVTHTDNMNQRFKRLSFAVSAGALNVTVPNDRNIVPPGHYMLFILNGNGVPSVAKVIQIL